ncbi:MAG: hypothetical protein HYZ34_05435 [Ignavibacteriae bacterium]|nr:hypothetical protein [Ignavibacteriota bacterium]
MKRTSLPFIIFALLLPATVLSQLPAISHYTLNIQLFPKDESLSAIAQITITNTTEQSFSELPFVLYRLLDVQSVTSESGEALHFTQDVQRFDDAATLQSNVVTVSLPTPFLPKQSLVIVIKYHGSIYGYPEVMAYTHDRIDEQYSLLRPDVLAYPLLSKPSFSERTSILFQLFTYNLDVTVPKHYTVACGGVLQNIIEKNDSTTFIFNSKVPTWRMDIAAGKFITIKDEERKLFIYAMPEDSVGALNVLRGMKNVIALYSRLFGEVKNYQGYTAIEIPDGWGSQAGDYYFMQTSAAFRDTNKLSEVYHEIGHTWDVSAKPEVQRCRYFDEAFASYFETLAIKEFNGEQAFLDDMERSRNMFLRWVNYDKKYGETPIAEYGKAELGQMSYIKGAWSLYVLHEVIGDEAFRTLIKTLGVEFENKSIDFKEFQERAERTSKKNLKKFFDEWIYGSESSQLLVDKISIEEIIKRYQ